MATEDPFGFDALDAGWLAAKPGAKWHRYAPRLAAWVADMDFPPAPVVVDALREVVEGRDYGYPDWPFAHAGSPLARRFVERMRQRYGWSAPLEQCRELNDVIQGVRTVLHLMSRPGDGVVLHSPAYPPFHDSLRSMNRRLVAVRAHADPTGWSFDYDDLDRRLRAEPGMARVWILCHPHNPTGHVFDRLELERIAQIAERHDLLVVSDEIHADLTYAPHRHLPMAALGEEVAGRTVTVTSASKAFNLAGLRWAVAHVSAPAVRRAWDQLPAHLLGAPNLMAVAAVTAAWDHGAEWLDACVAHLDRQRQRLAARLEQHLAGVGYHPPGATYLAWLDCRSLGLDGEPHEVFRNRGVELSPGPDFGAEYHGFVRLNFATSSSVLDRIVERMAGADPQESAPTG